MKSRLILFDVDGTLVDTAGAGRRAVERAYREVFGVDGVDTGASTVEYAGKTDPVILEEVAVAIGVGRERYQAGRDALRECFLRELRVEMERPEPRRRVLPGVRPLLEYLDTRADVHLGLLTGNIERGARVKLEAFDLNRFFPSGGFSSDHPDRREIARIAWRRLCELSGIDFVPEAVTVVGDTRHDVDCARANGFRAVATISGWVSRDSLEQARPDVLLDDLSDRTRCLLALGIDPGADR